MLHSIRIFEETHKNGSWRPKKSWMWVLWEAFSYIRQFEITHKANHDGQKDQNCDSCSTKSFFSKGQLTFDKSHQNSSWSANNVMPRSYSNFSNFQWLRHSFSYPYANVWMILLLSSPLHITLEEPLICDVAGAQNRVLWVLKITWLYGIFFSIWICICSKSNCTFLHFVLWKFIK